MEREGYDPLDILAQRRMDDEGGFQRKGPPNYSDIRQIQQFENEGGKVDPHVHVFPRSEEFVLHH